MACSTVAELARPIEPPILRLHAFGRALFRSKAGHSQSLCIASVHAQQNNRGQQRSRDSRGLNGAGAPRRHA
eukprot:5106269-Alexandrium_andersonii.AAC.1